eukprot:4821705-Pyramimonas_sp.AAC.1
MGRSQQALPSLAAGGGTSGRRAANISTERRGTWLEIRHSPRNSRQPPPPPPKPRAPSPAARSAC